MEAAEESELIALNAEVHAWLDGLWLDAMEAAVALDLAQARARWSELARGLARHAADEDALLVPHLARAQPTPRGGGPELMEAEHRKLGALAEAGEAALARLASSPRDGLRRRVVGRLEVWLRLRALLSHHGERERSVVYPHFAACAPAAARATLGERLAETLRGAR